MEARERIKSTTDLCPKCFEPSASAGGCVDPDCPLAEDLESGPESTVYPELAKANLYRMRGEYKLARDTCLSLLKRYPRNVTAHTLLGDIEAEEGDLEHSAQWYEMALELKPESEVDRQKLGAIRQRIQDHEAAKTAQQLGLPTNRPKALVFALLALVFVIAFGALAFVLGDRFRANKQPNPQAITNPITVVQDQPATEMTRSEPDSEKKETQPVEEKKEEPKTIAPVAGSDLQSRLAYEGIPIVAAIQDPRDQSLEVTIGHQDSMDDTVAAAVMAVSAMDKTRVPKVVIRVVKGVDLTLLGELSQEVFAGANAVKGEDGKYDSKTAIQLFKVVWPTPASTESSDAPSG